MEALFEAVLQASAKGSVVLCAALLVRWAGGRWIPASWRTVLWCIVLVRLALPTAPESRFSVLGLLDRSSANPAPLQAVLSNRPIAVQRESGTAGVTGPRSSLDLGELLLAIWLTGFLAFGLRLVVSHLRTSRNIRHFKPLPASELPALLGDLKRALRIRRKVQLLEAPGFAGPATFGIRRPAILIPPRLLELFTPAEQRNVLLHELAHIRRHDALLVLSAEALRAVHWFNPLVHLAVRVLRFDIELGCDAVALDQLRQEERRGYGLTLIRLLEHLGEHRPAAALQNTVESETQLRQRMTRITRFMPHGRRTDLATLLGLALFGAAFLTDPASTRASLEPAQATTRTYVPRHTAVVDLVATLGQLAPATNSECGSGHNWAIRAEVSSDTIHATGTKAELDFFEELAAWLDRDDAAALLREGSPEARVYIYCPEKVRNAELLSAFRTRHAADPNIQNVEMLADPWTGGLIARMPVRNWPVVKGMLQDIDLDRVKRSVEDSWPLEDKDYGFKAEIAPLLGSAPTQFHGIITITDLRTGKRLSRPQFLVLADSAALFEMGSAKETLIQVTLKVEPGERVATYQAEIFHEGKRVSMRRETFQIGPAKSVPQRRGFPAPQQHELSRSSATKEKKITLPQAQRDGRSATPSTLEDAVFLRVRTNNPDETATFDLRLEGDRPEEEKKILRHQRTPFDLELHSSEIRLVICEVSGDGMLTAELFERIDGSARKTVWGFEGVLGILSGPDERTAWRPDAPDPCKE